MSRLITIWRVTHGEKGIFQTDALNPFEYDNSKYPCTPRDPKIARDTRYGEVHGCHTRQCLNHWFGEPDVLEHLAQFEDIMIHKFIVDSDYAVLGKTQAIFREDMAVLEASFHISQLPQIVAGELGA